VGVTLLIIDILRSPHTEGHPEKLEAASPAGRTE
jgi:hypothetical protein